MGYTHYWRNPKGFTDEQWDRLVVEANRLFRFTKIPLGNGTGEEGSGPEVNDTRIFFNGVGDDSHETFNLTKSPQDFEFCKTAHKPYDAAVVHLLIEAKRINPSLDLSSDGGPKVFQVSRTSDVYKVRGYPPRADDDVEDSNYEDEVYVQASCRLDAMKYFTERGWTGVDVVDRIVVYIND